MQSLQAPASSSSGELVSHVSPSRGLRYGVAVVLFTVVFAVWFHAVVVHPASRVPCCAGDGTVALREMWVERAQHDNPLTFTRDPFNGAPEGLSRSPATTIAASALQTAFVWGLKGVVGDVGAWNLFLALGLVGSALAMFVLLQRLGCTVVASLFGGFVFGFGPYALERAYAGHLGLLQNWVLVLVVLALIRAGPRASLGSGAVVGLALGLAFWTSAYEGLFASLIVLVFVAVDLVRARTARERRRSGGLLAVAYAVGVAMLVPIFFLYARERSTFRIATARATTDLYTFAARISDYVVPSPRNPLFHWVSGAFSRGLTEHSLFVGYSTILLASTGVALLVLRNPWLHSSAERTRTAVAMVALALVAFVLSLPPSYRLGGARIPMPSTLLAHFTTNWRVYSRFGELVGMALVVLAAIALSALARRPGRGWRLVGPAALVVALVELFPGNVRGFDMRHGPAWVEWLASHPRGIVATYPVTLHDGPAEKLSERQLTYQLIDHDPGFEIVGKSYLQARSREQAIRSLAARLDGPVTAGVLATEGVRYVVVDDSVYRAEGLAAPRPDRRHFTLLRRLGDVRIYGVHARRLGLEAAVEAHMKEINAVQGEVLPPPLVAAGSGFNPKEPYKSSTGAWMIQDGRLEIENRDVTPLRVVITAVAFSNGRPRVLELRTESGKVLSRRTVQGYAAPVSFAPVEVGTGTSTLVLAASPGPAPIAPSDPRQASVFLTQLAARPVLGP